MCESWSLRTSALFRCKCHVIVRLPMSLRNLQSSPQKISTNSRWLKMDSRSNRMILLPINKWLKSCAWRVVMLAQKHSCASLKWTHPNASWPTYQMMRHSMLSALSQRRTSLLWVSVFTQLGRQKMILRVTGDARLATSNSPKFKHYWVTKRMSRITFAILCWNNR